MPLVHSDRIPLKLSTQEEPLDGCCFPEATLREAETKAKERAEAEAKAKAEAGATSKAGRVHSDDGAPLSSPFCDDE